MGWEECKGRAEDVLSRIIPKFGGSGILDAAAIAHVGRGIGGSKLKRTRPRSVCWCSQFGLTGAGAGLSGLKLGHLSLPLPSLSSTVSE